jgi:hypothetical protein
MVEGLSNTAKSPRMPDRRPPEEVSLSIVVKAQRAAPRGRTWNRENGGTGETRELKRRERGYEERRGGHTMRTPNNSQSIFQNSISTRIVLLKLEGMSAPSCDPREGNVPDWQCSSNPLALLQRVCV